MTGGQGPARWGGYLEELLEVPHCRRGQRVLKLSSPKSLPLDLDVGEGGSETVRSLHSAHSSNLHVVSLCP